MPPWNVLNERQTVQVFSPTLVKDVQEVEFQSFPSGSILTVYVPKEAWDSSGAEGSIAPFVEKVEEAIAGGLAASASSFQDVDPDTNLLTDYVRFVVVYRGPPPLSVVLSTNVDVPYNIVILDTQFGGGFGGNIGITGGSLTDRLEAA